MSSLRRQRRHWRTSCCVSGAKAHGSRKAMSSALAGAATRANRGVWQPFEDEVALVQIRRWRDSLKGTTINMRKRPRESGASC